jgi:predicted ester cyclase
MSIAQAKSVVRALWADLEGAPARFSQRQMALFHSDAVFHGPAPIDQLHGRDAIAEGLFAPLASAFPVVQRAPYLFLGGVWQGQTWVATTGNLIGEQVRRWCRVPAGAGPRTLRFGEFYRVEDGRIIEVRCLFDIPALAAQAGYRLLPPFAGRAEPPPAPALGNGLCYDAQDPAASAYTLQLVEDMLGGCNRLNGSDLASMGMAAYWHEDMVWHGPWGVGSCYGFREFQDHAQGPSVRSFPNRRGGFHQARFADGLTAAFTGWPSLRGTFNGEPFRGIPPTGGEIGQNIMDFYVRRDDRLHENWILIDLVDFARQCGVDLLARLPE